MASQILLKSGVHGHISLKTTYATAHTTFRLLAIVIRHEVICNITLCHTPALNANVAATGICHQCVSLTSIFLCTATSMLSV